MKKQYAVIGLGRFGFSVAKTLTEMDCEVLAIDNDEERVKEVSDFVTHAVILDAIDEKALRSAGIQNVDVAVVSIGENIEASILVVMMLKEMGIRHIVAKAVTPLHGKVLENLKVDRIVYPERDMAIRVAHSLIRPSIVDQLELSPEYSIVELPAPPSLEGKSLRESQLRTKYGANLIAIKRGEGAEREKWNVNPLPTDVIRKGDLLVLVGRNEDLERLSRL
ncbi:MAG: TrkA family potassium uptake protein [Alphaproteobacteria bacterium]|uniref:TrkA family potassium uptake protein n=1 Tax=Candidatus Nitrobium versatile TaxID=2884831 RepID=A0A953J9K8_9BACT|nr:TrkA family potassium uptake protein [Candidatus Nitrobium versatile]